VTVDVEVGLSDDLIDARIVHSSDTIFETSATDAARRSQYRSARRNGIPERGRVTMTFKFVAPQTPPPLGSQN
jgi:TonB family protein